MAERIRDVVRALDAWAPYVYQESYDNARLICGDPDEPLRGVLCCLDSTEAVVQDAVELGCNLIVAHHPILFGGLKSLTGRSYVERTLMAAVRAGVSICAAHTNLDAVHNGVNQRLAQMLGLVETRILDPRRELLAKLVVYVPREQAETLRQALYAAGAGVISEYDHCSFNLEGTGTFRGSEASNPRLGERGRDTEVAETRVDVLLPRHLEAPVLAAMRQAHPYEEVAYDLLPLLNEHPRVGHGMLGQLDEPMPEPDFLQRIKDVLGTPVLRHTALCGRPIQRVAVCGGAGIFLISKAIAAGAQAFITADIKYHQFFDAEGKILLVDAGHYESEQYTSELIVSYLSEQFPNFAVRLTRVVTNPVNYT
jgi:dinuclear metal center YbgI/SA1388 family protein